MKASRPADTSEPTDLGIEGVNRLAAAGWTVIRIGDPSHPEALLFTRDIGCATDSLYIKPPDHALATRQVKDQITATVRGTVDDMVTAALAWADEAPG